MSKKPRRPLVRNVGGRPSYLSDLYHDLLATSWPSFFLLVLMVYLTTNFVFAFAYFACGKSAFIGLESQSTAERFLDCFFFSVQTLATIGYGRISPLGIFPNLVVTFEALVGLMGLALITGLFFARFARPTSRVVFSSQAVILPLDGIPSLVFRIGNQRANQVVEAKINVSVLLTEQTSEGESFRNFYDLKLERNFSPIFALTWTIVHPIDSSSPLYGKTKKDLEDARAMILISFTGIDETFSQTVYSRFAYTPKDMVWNRRFKDILHFNPDGTVRVAIEDIHLTEDARVN